MAAPYGGPRFLAAGTSLARREGRQVSLQLRGPGGPRKAAVGELRMVIGTLGGELSRWDTLCINIGVSVSGRCGQVTAWLLCTA